MAIMGGATRFVAETVNVQLGVCQALVPLLTMKSAVSSLKRHCQKLARLASQSITIV